MNKNKIIIGLGILALVLVVLAVVGKNRGWIGSEDGVKVTTEQVTNRTIIERVAASGKIFPEVEVKISPDVSGEIVELTVQEGDSVNKGDHLVSIRPDVYNTMVDRAEASLNQARAQLASSKSRLTEVKARLKNVKQNYKRQKKLHEQGVISDAEFEKAETEYETVKANKESAEQEVQAAKFSVRSAQANLDEARENLEKTSISSPMEGIISRLNVEEGERVVGTDQMAGTEILRVAEFNNMEVRVNVSENDILRVSENDTAYIEVDAYPEREFKGIVNQIANSANISAEEQLTSDQVTNFTVEIRILRSSYKDLMNRAGKQFPFRPGMSASVEIETDKREDVVSVPIQSVTIKEQVTGDQEQGGSASGSSEQVQEVVFLHQVDTVAIHEVETGIQDDEYIEIKSGLSDGQAVVSGPYRAITRKLKSGSNVKVVEEEQLYQ
jgi:HlyD family secretion protein